MTKIHALAKTGLLGVVIITTSEFFSYFGLRVLLVRYMIEMLGMVPSDAYSLFGVYGGGMELVGLAAGWWGGRRWSLHGGIVAGMMAVMVGHGCLAYATRVPDLLVVALAWIMLGTGLIRSHCLLWLRSLYPSDHPAREWAYRLYYIGISLGALLASILCGTAEERLGWHAGFGMAALGMALGGLGYGVVYRRWRRVLKLMSDRPVLVHPLPRPCFWVRICRMGSMLLLTTSVLSLLLLYHRFLHLPLMGAFVMVTGWVGYRLFLASSERRMVWVMLQAMLLLGLFYSLEEQLGSTIPYFLAHGIDRQLGSSTVAVGVLLATGPLVMLSTGLIFAWKLLRERMGGSDRRFFYLTPWVGWMVLGLVYAGWYGMASLQELGVRVVWVYPVIAIMATALSELLVAPTLYHAINRLEPCVDHDRYSTALIFLSFGWAKLLAGLIGYWMAIDSTTTDRLGGYARGFGWMIVLALLVTLWVFVWCQQFWRVVREAQSKTCGISGAEKL